MLQPHTEKMHAIIERTAVFIAKHGVQMEIMMKTKQKDNTQFSFLNYEDELNAYYKHVLHAIKHLKYTPASAAQQTSADGKFCYLSCILFIALPLLAGIRKDWHSVYKNLAAALAKGFPSRSLDCLDIPMMFLENMQVE